MDGCIVFFTNLRDLQQFCYNLTIIASRPYVFILLLQELQTEASSVGKVLCGGTNSPSLKSQIWLKYYIYE
jgi:hypothetical protein